MTDTEPTELWEAYLPDKKLGRVESFLQRQAPALAAPIRSREELNDDLTLKIWSNATDACIRNITYRFSDGPTYFCLVATKTPNALIVKFDDFQCIVIPEALPGANLGLALKLLSSPSFFDFLESGTLPDDPSDIPSKTRDEALQSLFKFEQHDPFKYNHATFFLFFGAYFLCSHELGHLALGHLDRSDGSEAAIVEMDVVSDDRKLESRAREWDADIFASAATLWHIGQLLGEEGWSEALGSYSKSLRYFLATTYHFFTIFDFSSPLNRGQANPTHPEPLVRAGLLLPAIKELFVSWNTDQDEDVMEVGRETIRAFEIALFELTGGNMSRAEAERLQAKAELNLQEIGEAFQVMKPDLDRSRLADLFFARNLQ